MFNCSVGVSGNITQSAQLGSTSRMWRRTSSNRVNLVGRGISILLLANCTCRLDVLSVAWLPQMLTRNSLELNLKYPKFHKIPSILHKAVCYVHLLTISTLKYTPGPCIITSARVVSLRLMRLRAYFVMILEALLIE